MNAKIEIAEKNVSGLLHLSGSKSISNRLLILQALSGEIKALKNLSTSDDTHVLQKALASKEGIVDVGIAGTAMRFLTAYFAIKGEEVILTGAARMKQRPIKELVDALRVLGAEISYKENEGFPPLKIKGKKIKGGHLKIKADVSSQFISSILMIAPYFESGIQLELIGDILSRPYIEMTLNLMQQQGVNHSWKNNIITVDSGRYSNNVNFVESDWSSVSYLFELVALSMSGKIQMTHVINDSVQGDQEVMHYFELLGIDSSIKDGMLTISKKPNFKLPSFIEYDCTNTPDLAQTLASTASGMGVSMKIVGLKSLPIKETNRLLALKTELEKYGTEVRILNNEALEIIPKEDISSKDLIFETYGDHRMAMCLAPLALKSRSVTLSNPEVVNKSYRDFWNHLKCIGFNVYDI